MDKLLVIYVDETDTVDDLSLYEAICRKLVQLGAPGATVLRGIMGFGKAQHIHRQRLFGVPDDRPIQISVVANEEFLRETVIPAVKPMLSEGIMFLVDVELVGP